METDKPDLENLYLKKITGTLTPDEHRYLDQLNANAADGIEFEKIERLWNDAAKLSLQKGSSPNERWNTLQQNIQKAGEAKAIPFYKTLWKYAAVITLLIILVGVYFYPNSSETITVQTKNGEKKTVILPDQSTVTLNAGSLLA